MNKRGSTLLLVVILIFAVVLAACSKNNNGNNAASSAPASESASPSDTASESPSASPSESASAAPSDDSGPVTIKVQTWIPADDNWNKMVALFNAQYPDIKVEMISQGGMNILQQNIAAGEPIDVFWANSLWEPFSQGYVENLQPYIDADPDFGSYNFLPGMLDTFKIGSDIYGLSRGNDLGLIFYNKDLMDKYGITPPATNWTFTDMKEMAKKATNAAEKTWGFNNTSYNIGWLASTVPYANGHTDDIYGLNAAHDTIMWTGDNTDVLDDMNYFYDITTKDQSMLNWGDSQAAGYSGGDLFAKGQALFSYDISFQIRNFSNPDSGLKFKWDVAPIPGGTAKQANYAQQNPIFMASASKHKDAAWKFIKFWTTNKDFQNALADAGYTFPNTADADVQAHFKTIPFYQTVNQDALEFASTHPIYDPTYGMIGGNYAWDSANYIGNQAIETKTSAYDNMPASAEEKNKLIADAKVMAEKVMKVQEENKANQ